MKPADALPVRISCRKCRSKFDAGELEPFSLIACPVCGTTLRIPRRFGRYLLEKVCGVGGMSKIYRAIDPRLERRVAVKILTKTGSSPEESARLFFHEAKLVADLDHPGIVPIYHSGIEEGSPFLVMRFLSGGDLERLFRAGTLPPARTLLGYLATIADALLYMFNEAGLVHHDIKPSNILLDGEGGAQLGDFDLADVREFGDLRTPCEEWGSPVYISPERLYSGGEDCRGDIFSLGATIYELLSGAAPFGIAGTAQEHHERRRAMNFAPLAEAAPGVSQEFSELVGRMLAFDPAARPGYPEILRALRNEAERRG